MVRTIRVAAALVALSSAIMAHAADRKEEAAAKLAPYAGLVDACEDYLQALRSAGWTTVWRSDFDKPGDWVALDPRGNPIDGPSLTSFGDRSVLEWEAPQGAAQLKIGPVVKGSFRVVLVGLTDSEAISDLSIFTNAVGQGPGFQFGGNANERNTLWLVKADGTWGEKKELPTGLLIRRKVWHEVRMEIKEGVLRGFVDQKLLGEETLGDGYDLASAFQPLLYTFGMTVYLDRAIVQTFDPGDVKASAVLWKRHLGERTEADVQAAIDALIKHLDHEKYQVRRGARLLLARISELAAESLRKAIENGTPEQQWQAREALLE